MAVALAFASFLSALLLSVTATLAPIFGSELGARPTDLGAHIFGFAAMHSPLGRALERCGARGVLIVLLSAAGALDSAVDLLSPQWPTQVFGQSAAEAGAGLFAINLSML